MKQITFTDAEQSVAKKTCQQLFLEKMDKVVPWGYIIKQLEGHYYESGKVGRQAYPLEVMLRMFFLQQWYNLSDQRCEEYLLDVPHSRAFVGIDSLEKVPDQNTLLNFRHFLEQHDLQDTIFDAVNMFLADQGLITKNGAIVDATIIEAPRSTKNSNNTRDPEMSSVAKNQQWYFGMKTHCLADEASGLVYRHKCTTAKEHDSTQIMNLLDGEKQVYGDKAYCSKRINEELEVRSIKNNIQQKYKKNTSKEERAVIKQRNNLLSKVRCRGEHVFGVIKSKFNYRKISYTGLKKNSQRMSTLLALANLYTAAPKLLNST